jgi:filamentous hemagglutinin family protein
MNPTIYKKTRQIMTCLIASYAAMNLAQANPVLDNVAAGDVKVQQESGNMIVNQTSDKAILNWESFNINKNEKVHFEQPTGGVALNRINPAQGVSEIYGSLSSTGQIILLNGAGIHFGPNAHVNVGGIIASAGSGISDKNFMQGDYIFDQASSNKGSVINEGDIQVADYGLVALMGNSVVNHGVIKAQLGKVILASGDQFTLSFFQGDRWDGLINFVVDTSASQKGAGVTNTGKIQADGGLIAITAKDVAKTLDNVINLDGVIQANAVSEQNGVIAIYEQIPDAGDEGNQSRTHATINVKGKISANGAADAEGGAIGIYGYDAVNVTGKISATEGGNIVIISQDIAIKDKATLDVSGNQGGGKIGLWSGDHLLIEKGATLSANALIQGDGGAIAALSDKHVKIDGKLSVRGGSKGGDGGFVVVDGVEDVDFSKQVDISAPHGIRGFWVEGVNGVERSHS